MKRKKYKCFSCSRKLLKNEFINKYVAKCKISICSKCGYHNARI